MNPHVVFAIFLRNFKSYFSIPLGYVFICAFVLLSGIAAFWPHDFFNSNLATLDQLNRNLPWIMLVFIPAITMSIWAEERREGTDELVLTLPCTDLDVVIGKYLAAVAIFTVALFFSLSNIVVLIGLGEPDLGLLLGNYIGYWLVGTGMLAVGMVASFLTSSLTVGFILALAFNAPLVFVQWADSIVVWDEVSRFLKSLGIAEQFRDFGRGLITLSGIVFFASIALVSLYLSMVLIGRRHWGGGTHGSTMAAHFSVRTLAIIAVVIGLNVLAARFDMRVDASAERINSLSSETIALVENLDTKRPVYIEAYISPQVPEEYVQTRLNLINMLLEMNSIGGDKVVVRMNNAERFSAKEAEAQQQFNITPRPVQTAASGRFAIDEITLGAAVSCGLDKVTIPFFDRGIPVEYEIIRSIATVSQQQRKRVGVVTTDAKLFGGFDVQTMSSRPNQQIIDELQKQFEVVQVDPESEISEEFDVLLAVQPSSLSPTGMDNFLEVVSGGQPTVIFEDPFPFLDASVPGTSQPRQPPRQNPFAQQPPPLPKSDIKPLWDMLGINFVDGEIVWQDYNPYPKLAEIPPEFVFVGEGSGANEPFNESNPVTSGLQQMLTVFSGSITAAVGATTKFVPLITTGQRTGVVDFNEILRRNFLGGASLNPNRRFRETRQSYTLAAHITGSSSDESEGSENGAVNVILVTDIDVLYSVFFAMRARGTDPNDPVDINLDNVTFVLNTLDYLAGDERFLEIRKRRPAHRTLTTVERRTEQAKGRANSEREKFISEFEAKRQEEQLRLDERLAELRQREGVDPQQLMIEVATAQEAGNKRINATIERLERERDRQIEMIERDVALEIRQVQDRYKFAAIALPPIPPLLLALFVYKRRRNMEQIGVPKARLR